MPNSAPHKINVTAYIVLSVLAVLTVFVIKFCSVETHETSPGLPRETQIQDAGIVIEDLNGTLSASNEAWLKTMIRAQMQFHDLHTPLQEEPLKVKVSLWGSSADFKAYQRRISKNSTSANGFYSVSRQELVVNKTQTDYLKTLAHEAQHMLIRRDGFRPPKWLNEGLSEYFEEMGQDRAGESVVRAQDWRIKRLQEWLIAGDLPPLPQFLSGSSSEWKARDQKVPHLSQTLSWGVVYFLMHTPQGRTALLETIKGLKRNQYEGDSSRILNDHYALGQLEQDLHRFIPDMPLQQKYLKESSPRPIAPSDN